MKSTLVILLLLPGLCYSQSFETRRNQMFALNIITAGVIGGIGSAVHKKEGQTRGKAFVNGFWKGCIGGSLTFTGKYMTYGITKNHNYSYAWPAKLVHAAGASIMENAASNRPIYDNFAIDFGPLRVDVNQKGKVLARLQPGKLIGVGVNICMGNRFLLKQTAQTGTMYFAIKDTGTYYVEHTTSDMGTQDHYSVHQNIKWGNTVFNSIAVNQYHDTYSTFAHEMIHCFQEREQLSINNVYFKNKNKWIYWDFPVSGISYLLAGKHRDNSEYYYRNIFELEAESLSSRTNPYFK